MVLRAAVASAIALALFAGTVAAACGGGEDGADLAATATAAAYAEALRAHDENRCDCAGIGGSAPGALVATATYDAAAGVAVAVGESATASGLAMKVSAIRTATDADSRGLAPPSDGATWVVVDLVVSNTGGADHAFPETSFACSDGRAYGATPTFAPGTLDVTQVLKAGARVEGKLLLARPAGCESPLLIVTAGGAVAAWRVA
jgi:hypothetical protein